MNWKSARRKRYLNKKFKISWNRCRSNEEITKAIMSMDGRDVFPVDMVEQMLKFTPTPEERALLDEHAEELDHMARADRFLFE